MIPLHLVEPVSSGRACGVVRFNGGEGRYEMEAEPRVLQVARRVLPGCQVHVGRLHFRPTPRTMEDMNWLLTRYPMEIECLDRYRVDLERARTLAGRRESGVVPPLPEMTGRFVGQLRDYQVDGVSFLVHNRRALLADDIGLGKTVMAMGALAGANAWPAVVVCPTPVMGQWVDHAQTFLQVGGHNLLNDQAVVLRGKTPYEVEPYPVYVLHYGLLQYWANWLIERGVRVVVFDEVQDLRHRQTKKYSAATAISKAVDFVWGLSGTPIHNYGGEIWSVLNAIEEYCLDDYGSFSREWCTGYDSLQVEDPALLGSHLRREGLMMRRVRDEVALELPPIRRAVVRLDHDADQYRAGVAKVMSLARSYEGLDFAEKGEAKRRIIAEARRASGIAKAPYAAAFIEGLLDAGEKVIIFSWHHAVHDFLFERLSKRHRGVKLTGRQTPTEKALAQAEFAEGKADFIELSLRTSAGLNGLQKRGTCVVFPELDWSPAVHAQCEGRLHRFGVELESVLCYYLVASTGYDETMQEALGLKVGQISGLLGLDVAGGTGADGDVKRHLDGVIERLAAVTAGKVP